MEEWIQKMWYIYMVVYYSAIKSNESMKFLGKWIELENINLSEVTQSEKTWTWNKKEISFHQIEEIEERNELADKWILAPKLTIPKIQFTDHMKLKKTGDQTVDTLVLLRKGIKIPMAHSQPMDWAYGLQWRS